MADNNGRALQALTIIAQAVAMLETAVSNNQEITANLSARFTRVAGPDGASSVAVPTGGYDITVAIEPVAR